MTKALGRSDPWPLVLVASWAIIAALLLWPLVSVFKASLIEETGQVGFGNYIEVLTSRGYRRTILNTLLVGFGGMAGALLLGLGLAVLTTRYVIRGRGLIQVLAIVALVSPPFIGAYAWIVLFGANGVVRNGLATIGLSVPPIYGAPGVILVFALKFFPHVYLITSAALGSINRSLEEAAESLGASPARRFWLVTMPLAMPAITASGLLAFVLSIADFGTPRLIGRDFSVLATEAFVIYSSEVGGNPGMAATISIVLVVVSMILVALQRRASRRNIAQGSIARRQERIRLDGWRSAWLHITAYAIVLIGALPAITAVIFSFRRTSGPVFQDGFSLQSYARVWSTVSLAIWNTLIYSGIAVVAIVLAGSLMGYLITRRPSRWTAALDAVLVIPYIVPGIVIGIAFIVVFNNPPLALTGTGAVIILAIFIRRLPYAARAVAAALKQLSPSLEEAAISLGYAPSQAFARITVPLITPGILAGALMSLVTAMNELSSSLVLYVGGTVTMPVRIYLSVLDGEYGTASALATILLALTVAAVYAAFRISGQKEVALI
jgi:iron(III) transport system permease protein